jgi:hypothetical protein
VSYISRHSRAVAAASEASGDLSVQLHERTHRLLPATRRSGARGLVPAVIGLSDQRAVMGGRRGPRLKGLILTARGVHLV